MPERIAIVGVGQIGGSFGLAFRAIGMHVLGIDRSQEVLERARDKGALDTGSTRLEDLRGVPRVMLAVPLDQLIPVARDASPYLDERALWTDVGSVKGPIVRSIEAMRPAARFVGGHPMFGTEHEGIAFADRALLEGAPFLLTPTSRTDTSAVAELEELVRSIGMQPLRLLPEEHDRQVARVSHLPYLIAAALARATEDPRCAGPAFRDMTRVAGSPPPMWRAILSLNREPLREAAGAFLAELTGLLELEGDELQRALEEAKRMRERAGQARGANLRLSARTEPIK